MLSSEQLLHFLYELSQAMRTSKEECGMCQNKMTKLNIWHESLQQRPGPLRGQRPL